MTDQLPPLAAETDIDQTAEAPRPSVPDASPGDVVPAVNAAPEPTKDAFVYAADFDPDDLNDAHGLVVRMVGEGKRVLEVGCAEGSTTRVLQARGCRVTGIEIDPSAAETARQFADAVIVGDLDTMDYHVALGDARFDVIIAADVLEHLRYPMRCVLACAEHLAPGGEFVLSIPNVAHADVRLDLAAGHFDYREWGLLDDTHVRFFTRSTLLAFLSRCGLAEVELHRVTRAIGTTELAPPLDRFPDLMEHLAGDPEADTYQFVLRAVPLAGDPHLAALAGHREALEKEVSKLRSEATDLICYRIAHRRLMHLLTPDLLDADVVGPGGNVAAEKAREVERVVHALLDERETMRRQVQSLAEEVQVERSAHAAAAETAERLRRELEDVRRCDTYRLGSMILAPAFAARRTRSKLVNAWRRSGAAGPGG